MFDNWNESLGAAMESAAASLPQGYSLRVDIERYGYNVKLILPDGVAVGVDQETLIDEIEVLVVAALRHYVQEHDQ